MISDLAKELCSPFRLVVCFACGSGNWKIIEQSDCTASCPARRYCQLDAWTTRTPTVITIIMRCNDAAAMNPHQLCFRVPGCLVRQT